MTKALQHGLLAIYCAAIFVSSALLFLVQPMVAKMILPYLGGSPAVWNTCLFFFQSCLLAGYVYAHIVSSRLGVNALVAIHLALAAIAVVFLPITLPAIWFTQPFEPPARIVLSGLFAFVGFPFLMLSASSPLLQRWFSGTDHSEANDPYFLYAASNLGSLAGLLSYPFLFEPRLSLSTQSSLWLYGYLGFLVLMVACGFSLLQSRKRLTAQSPWLAGAANDPGRSPYDHSVTILRRCRWLFLSMVPSSLLLGVTTYTTTDLASVPLLWVVPLCLYLLSFVAAFARKSWALHPFVVKRQPFLLLAAAVTLFVNATHPAWILIPLHLLSFSVTALICHGQLAQDRPRPQFLTEFYLWISLGGVLGGFFNVLLAPLLFNSVQEYPLAIIAAALLRPHGRQPEATPSQRWLDFVLPLGLGVLVLTLIMGVSVFSVPERLANILIFGIAGVLCMSFGARPLRFALGIAAILLASSTYTGPFGALLRTERSFFGVYRAMLDKSGEYRLLFHGTTLHGAQSLDPERRLEPLSYYHPSGPAGEVLGFLSNTDFNRPVAIIGLGAGSLACYGRMDQEYTFFEIDPLVERLARDDRLFTFLRDCPSRNRVIIGDARISLNRTPDHYYGLFVLDAFSSDAIPIHLLTKEAMELYLSKLDSEGILLFHISNRYLDLAPILGRLAATLNLSALLRDDTEITDEERKKGKEPSRWVVLARREVVLAPLRRGGAWHALPALVEGELWTDNYSNIFHALKWN